MISLLGMDVHDSNLQTYEDEWMEYEIEGTVFNNQTPATMVIWVQALTQTGWNIPTLITNITIWDYNEERRLFEPHRCEHDDESRYNDGFIDDDTVLSRNRNHIDDKNHTENKT
jgi:hypothetical protein